jgi:hypothetical protein
MAMKGNYQTENMKTLQFRNSINRSPLPIGFILFAVLLACFALPPTVRALLPPPAPDGGYLNSNTAEGTNALFSLTTGSVNTANGAYALFSNTTGGANTANGSEALGGNTTGDDNTANGFEALISNTTGTQNTATGARALADNTTASNNTATGFAALGDNFIGTQNTANGAFALASNRTASNNTADGFQALLNNQTGKENTAVGESAFKNSTVDSNTGVGFQVAFHNTTGTRNTAVGHHALSNNRTGSSNIALGESAGVNLTTGSNNIDIGSGGGGGESNTIRIGSAQVRTFIKGISGAVVSGAAVVVNAGGQLGMAASSERFKDEIKPMDKASEVILSLRPVSFCYKKEIDPDSTPQFGLVAEEVEKINPDLVGRDAQGKVFTVRYEAVNAMLLNEFLKEHRKVEELTKDFQATVAQLTARLDEQAAQIQKVSAQFAAASPSRGGLEASKPAPRVVSNP